MDVVVPVADQISLGVLTQFVPRDDVEFSVAEHGKQAKRSGGSLPPQAMMFYVAAMALHADLDYEGVLRAVAGPMGSWGSWRLPTSGGIAQARQRLGFEPVKTLFERIAVPVAGPLTRSAFCAGYRMVSFDGMVFDVPDTVANRQEFGVPSGGGFPQARVVTMVECGSHVDLGARIGGVTGKGSGERSASRELVSLLDESMLHLCDAGFYSFELWCAAVDTGARLLWRLGDVMDLPVIERLGDGSYTSLLFAPKTRPPERHRLIERARDGEDLAGEQGRVSWTRVVEYEVGDRGSGDLICLLTTLFDARQAPALTLAHAYHDRWEHETANKQIKSQMRGPGKILRSKSPDMVRQEIYGYLIAHYAVCALICQAAEDIGVDPDRIKFTNTLRIVRDRLADPDAFSP